MTAKPEDKLVCPECGVHASCQCGTTPVSKHKAATHWIELHPDLNDRAISEKYGKTVSRPTIQSARAELANNQQADEQTENTTRVGADGKRYPSTYNKARPEPKQAVPPKGPANGTEVLLKILEAVDYIKHGMEHNLIEQEEAAVMIANLQEATNLLQTRFRRQKQDILKVV